MGREAVLDVNVIDHETGSDMGGLDLAESTTIESFMLKVFPRPSREQSEPSPVGVRDPRTNGEDGVVDTLLEQASRAIEVLAARCGMLESELENTRASNVEQAATIESWRKLASNLKNQATVGEQKLLAVTARCEAAEARVVSFEQASKQATERALIAEKRSMKLDDKVIAAFGKGSRVHSVLQATTFQEAAE